MNGPERGYLRTVIPDDTAGSPLTPGEQAAIADLERRLLLDAPAPVRDRLPVARPVRVGSTVRRRPLAPPQSTVPVVALLATACVLVAVLTVAGGGLLGAAAVLASVVGTALLWPLVPTWLGGPVRPARRPYRTPGQLPGRR
jgi:hypothetical protein